MNIAKEVGKELNIPKASIDKVLQLFAEGATVPFVARYRKEATGNLDEETGKKVEDLLFQLNKESGTTLVIVTHDLTLAGKTNRVIKLKGGKVIES